MQTYVTTAPAGAVRITGDHGYRIEGDTAYLNAELALVDGVTATGWALQLWACDNPHASGPLMGIKVAEAPVMLGSENGHPCRLEVATFAAVPARRRDYVMVLVLASGAPGAFEQVHDFANYPMRQSFDVPHLDGALRYTIEGNSVLLVAERVTNPRPFGTASGTLALELWAQSEPFSGTAIMNGEPLARAIIGSLPGQGVVEQVFERAEFTLPPLGEWHMVLALSEWTQAAGFVVRDFCNFSAPLCNVPVAPPEPERAARRASAAEQPIEAARPEPAARRRPTLDEIALAAYYRFLARAGRPGSADEDWMAAERELL
jgi:hypothetical protein